MDQVEKCEYCKFFIPNICRRNPPTIIATVDRSGLAGCPTPTTIWPEVDKTDWCGRFKRK